MSENTPSQPSHESKSTPANEGWRDIKSTWNEASRQADHFDQVWAFFGGEQIELLQNQLAHASADESGNLKKQLDGAKWRFYDNETRNQDKIPNVNERRKDRDTRIDMYATERDRRRQIADLAQEQWDEIGGSLVDEAEMKLIAARKQKNKAPLEYNQAKQALKTAKRLVKANWQKLQESTTSVPGKELDLYMGPNDRQDYVPNWEFVQPESAASGDDSESKRSTPDSEPLGDSRPRETPTSTDETTSTEAHENSTEEESRHTAETTEAEKVLITEAEAKKEMEAQIEAYKVQGHSDAAWDKLQQSIWQYEALQSDRRKREINAAIDEAYHAAAEADAQDSPGEHESADDHTSSEEAPYATGTSTAETEVITGDDVHEPTDVTESPTHRARKVFTRARRASKRLRNRLHIGKYTRAQNITRIRKESAAADQPQYAEFLPGYIGAHGNEHSSLGDLVRENPLEATILDNNEDESRSNRAA